MFDGADELAQRLELLRRLRLELQVLLALLRPTCEDVAARDSDRRAEPPPSDRRP
jgi:hypothetical protein